MLRAGERKKRQVIVLNGSEKKQEEIQKTQLGKAQGGILHDRCGSCSKKTYC